MIMSVKVTRTLLGKGDLELNDHYRYIVASISPGDSKWRRKTTSSPYLDGAVTTQRARDNSEMQILVDILSQYQAEMGSLKADLVEAFEQDSYTLTVVIDGYTTSWLCETADYRNDLQKERLHGGRQQIAFMVPRKPVATAGIL